MSASDDEPYELSEGAKTRIRDIVAQWPPLSDEQIHRLRLIFGGAPLPLPTEPTDD